MLSAKRSTADEGPPFEVINARGSADVVLVCDHASNIIPRCLRGLGLRKQILQTHIAWDAGAAALARELAARLDAPLVLANYSRLVIDCNRHPGSLDSITPFVAAQNIPGNRGLGALRREWRVRTFFEPYHQAISRLIDARRERPPALLAIHSFNRVLNGRSRPWSIGICHGDDPRLAMSLLDALAGKVDGPVGNNHPYSIEADIDYTLPRHGAARNLPHVMLEVRRDKLRTRRQVLRWAELLAAAWRTSRPG